MKQAVKEANSKKELAYFVRGHIRQLSDDLRAKEDYIARREGSVKSFTDRLKMLGVIWNPDDNSWHEIERVRSEIDRLFKQVDGQLLDEMGYVAGRLKQVSDQIKELRKDE
jgi:methyl-accepting chemotaxis protein